MCFRYWPDASSCIFDHWRQNLCGERRVPSTKRGTFLFGATFPSTLHWNVAFIEEPVFTLFAICCPCLSRGRWRSCFLTVFLTVHCSALNSNMNRKHKWQVSGLRLERCVNGAWPIHARSHEQTAYQWSCCWTWFLDVDWHVSDDNLQLVVGSSCHICLSAVEQWR